MQFFMPSVLLALTGLATCNPVVPTHSAVKSTPTVATHAAPSITPTLPFNFTRLFTAQLNVGKPSHPITIPGGTLLNEPITNGTVSGPAINGTIQGGFAHPTVYSNGALQAPVIDIYGVSDDGMAFYIHEAGVGSAQSQVTRIEISIGGTKYAQLADGFVLASVNSNAARTGVTVEGYLVQNTL